jgi:6-pyruvoyltetrahydropterin/6-carboxytetrahydropterin synthase
MVRLTREVRFAVNLNAAAERATLNGHGGAPALVGAGMFLTLRVTLEGELDPVSSYLRNIKEIDAQVRKLGVPAIETQVRSGGFTYAIAIRVLRDRLVDAWPGAQVTQLELLTTPFQSVSIQPSEPNMIRLSQRFEFSAAHRLHNPDLGDAANRATFGKCNNPLGHGHNYELQVTVAGEPGSDGCVIGMGDLERIVETSVIDKLDHKHLNLEVPEFKTLNPSVENIAKVIYTLLKPGLNAGKRKLASVTVWETPRTWCEYSE